MPQGLQVWDAAGALMLDTSQFTTRFLGAFTKTATENGFINVVKQPQERIFIQAYADGGGQAMIYLVDPLDINTFDPEGTQIRWQFDTLGKAGTTGYFIYGVF